MPEGLHNIDVDAHAMQVQSLLVRHATSVRAFVMGMTLSRDLADDVMQEVFIRVTQKAGDFELGTDFVAWACTVAKYVVLEHIRQAGKSRVTLPPDVIEALADRYAVVGDVDERIDLLHLCMNRLSPSAQRVIDLRYSGALKSSQIAERMGLRAQTVYVTLSRARSALRQCIEAQMRRLG